MNTTLWILLGAVVAIVLLARRIPALHPYLEKESLAAFFLGVGILLAVMFLVVLFWDTHRLAALGFFAIFFATAGALLLLALRARARSRPRFLAATVAELNKDRQKTGDGA